ncbi:MAG: hypothetical protein IPK19_36430 [Chloroflexi bacterium]|nr:hypothetical protein [Chloroflexota bacterium]
MRARFWVILVLLLVVLPQFAAGAQDVSFYWENWNASINVSEAEQTLSIAESQTFVLQSGTIRRGSRAWLDPVTINTVYVNMPDGELVELERSSGGETPGTYEVSTAGDEITLRYYFPEPVNGGDSFLVQINYTVPLLTENLVDWYVIPENHAAPINSSVVQINFLDADAPPEGLARVVSNNATVRVQAQTVSIMTPNALDVDEPLYVQMPFGAGAGAASNNQSGGVAAQATVAPRPTSVPATPTNQPEQGGLFGFSLDSLLPILCIIIVVAIVLGGRGSSGCLGMLLSLFLGGRGGGIGGSGGGIFPGGGSGSGRTRTPSGPFGGGSSGGGFRRSGNQGRSAPTVRNRKGGGSAGLG